MIETSKIRSILIDNLRAELSDFEVIAFPNRPQEYTLTHPKGALLVAFDGINFTNPSMIQQGYTLSISITVLFNSTIDSNIMLDDLDRIRQAVTNNYIYYGAKFYCVSQQPLGEEDNIWYYKLKFILPGIIMQGD